MATKFNEAKWVADLQKIPEGEVFRRCHAAVLAEWDRRKALPQLREQMNATARQYYELPMHTKTQIDGGEYLEWVKPPLPALGYPTGIQVAHEGKVWTQTYPEPTMEEPGAADEVWVADEVPGMEPAEEVEE